MVDKKASEFTSITPILTDEFIMTDDPGGTPANARATGTAVLAMLKASTDTYYYGKANVKFTTADFSVASSITLVNITGLSYNVESGSTYRLRAVLFISNDAAGGSKVAVAGPATSTYIMSASFQGASFVAKSTASKGVGLTDTAKHEIITIECYQVVNDTGTLAIRYAQSVSNATASIVLAGSWMQVDKIA